MKPLRTTRNRTWPTPSRSPHPSLKTSCAAVAPPPAAPLCHTPADIPACSKTTTIRCKPCSPPNPTSRLLNDRAVWQPRPPCKSVRRLCVGLSNACPCCEKKSQQASQQQPLEVQQQQRADCRQQATTWLAAQLQGLEEIGSQVYLTRLYGRALSGERVVEGVPSAYGSNYTLPGVLSVNGIQAPWLVEGALEQTSATSTSAKRWLLVSVWRSVAAGQLGDPQSRRHCRIGRGTRRTGRLVTALLAGLEPD